jgi:hypothetical membrane protein
MTVHQVRHEVSTRRFATAVAQGGELRAVTAGLAAAGLVGPTWFAVLVVLQGLLHPDYSHVALPISALAAWPSGWIQNVNFVVFGVLMGAYAIGLHLGVRQGPGGALGPALLVLSGVGLVLAGTFPWRAADGDFVVPPGHLAGAFLSFLGAGSGLMVLSWRLAADPLWRGLARYALVTGITLVVLFLALFALTRLPDSPRWAGLLQRVTTVVWFACTMILAVRLRRVVRATQPTD